MKCEAEAPLIVRAMRTVEDSTETTGAATTHHQHGATVARHLSVVGDQDRERSGVIHLATATPYHQVTIAADSNNNHDHHRNLEHHAIQRHDHWNKCKSILKKGTRKGQLKLVSCC